MSNYDVAYCLLVFYSLKERIGRCLKLDMKLDMSPYGLLIGVLAVYHGIVDSCVVFLVFQVRLLHHCLIFSH